ncbi:MAG: hypothetical protein ABWZ40_08345 [Caulobacterales bacterium]
MTEDFAGPIVTGGPTHRQMKFGSRLGVYQHTLHTNPLFDEIGLSALIDAYPRDRLAIYTMGQDAKDHRSWRRGAADNLNGVQLLAAIKNGCLWAVLRKTNLYLDGYQQLVDRMFADLHRMHPGLSTFRHDFGVVIASPKAQVFYHLDMPMISLWQVRGEKTLRAWPAQEPYLNDRELEHLALQDSHGGIDYNQVWDMDAEEVVLKPGMMATWPQNGPHRIVNSDSLNVALSVDFMTPAAMFRQDVIYANGVLRQKFNMPQRTRPGLTPQNILKAGLGQAARRLNWIPATAKSEPITFEVEQSAPNSIRDTRDEAA